MTGSRPTRSKATPDQKLAELILYIAERCYQHERFGATKLNKILFFSDFHAYRMRGKAITGTEYFKLPKGPAPKRLKPVWEQMKAREEVVMKESTLFGRIQKRTIPLRQPNLDIFDADEIAIVDQVISWLKDDSANNVSELSHLYVLDWDAFKEKEIIPYHTVFARFMKSEHITEHDIKTGQEIERKLGLA